MAKDERPCPEFVAGLLEELRDAEQRLEDAIKQESLARSESCEARNRVNNLRSEVHRSLRSYDLTEEVR